MKDSNKYSKEIQKLYRNLKKDGVKVAKVHYEEPMEALVYAIMSEHFTASHTESAMKRFPDYFVDLNDLRVSRLEEMVELLGEETETTIGVFTILSKILTTIFDKTNTISLDHLKKIGKRPAREALEKMEGVSRFAIDYCILTSLEGHAVPLTKTMVEFMKGNGLVHPEATEDEIEGFLARQISADNAFEFYSLLRTYCETAKPEKKKPAPAAKSEKKSKPKEKHKK